jgi:hypothetical protein
VIVDARRIVDMVMDIDHVKASFLHVVMAGMKHRYWLEILQQQGFLLISVRIGLVADLIVRRSLRPRPRPPKGKRQRARNDPSHRALVKM